MPTPVLSQPRRGSRGPIPQSFEKRFWSHVDKTQTCWLWTGPQNGKGYGVVKDLNRVQHYVHRISWILANGEIPEKLHVLHQCDVCNCVRPSHLFLGTPQTNHQDMKNKNRQYENYAHNPPRGSKHRRVVLTENEVRQIRKSFAAGETLSKLAKKFQVSHSCASHIVHRRSWSWLSA